MSQIIQQAIIWQQEKIDELSKEIAKELSRTLKSGKWYNYHLRFKKDRAGDIIISNPSVYEIEVIEKFIKNQYL